MQFTARDSSPVTHPNGRPCSNSQSERDPRRIGSFGQLPIKGRQRQPAIFGEQEITGVVGSETTGVRFQRKPLGLSAYHVGANIQLIKLFADADDEFLIDPTGSNGGMKSIRHLRVPQLRHENKSSRDEFIDSVFVLGFTVS